MSMKTLPVMLQLLRLHGGPQDLPADQGALVFWIGASMFAGLLVAAPLHGVPTSLFLSALDLLVVYVLLMALLGLRALTARWLQTYIALVGVSTLLGLVMSVLLWLLPPDFTAEQSSGLTVLVYLGLVVWLLLSFGHILREALSLRSRGAGVLLALMMVLISSLITQAVLAVAL